MAARKTTRLSSEWRERIKAGELLERMQRHALGEVEMKASEIRAAEVLLKKALPDLSSMEMQVSQDTVHAEELPDAELNRIASDGGSGVVEAEESPPRPSGVH